MIVPLKDQYLISANEEANSKTESGLFIDTTWEKYKWAVQVGIIESIPQQLRKPYRNDVEINKGDKVYFHHFVVQQDNYIEEDGKKLFKCPRFHLYCVIKNGIPVMIDDWILATPILEKEEDIVKTFGTLKLFTKATPDKLHLLAVAEHISKQAEEQGLKVGDTIVFRKDADYDMKIEGKDYYRMSIKNVVAIIRDKKVIPMREEVLIVNNAKSELVRDSGIIMPIFKPNREVIEKIVAIGIQDEEKQFKINDEILFHYGIGAQVEYEGVKYIVLKQEEVIGLLQEA